MSEAVLRAQQSSYLTDIRYRKVIPLPQLPKDVEISPEYINLMVERKSLHAFTGASQGHSGTANSAEKILEDNRKGWLWVAAVSIAAIIIIVGFVLGYLIPGPLTGIILPIGMFLWWLIYKLARHYDQLG